MLSEISEHQAEDHPDIFEKSQTSKSHSFKQPQQDPYQLFQPQGLKPAETLFTLERAD